MKQPLDDKQGSCPNDQRGLIEAVLFVAQGPVDLAELSNATGMNNAQVLNELVAIKDKLQKNNYGWVLAETASGWQFVSNPIYYEMLDEYVKSWEKPALSSSALEVLAALAYAGPLTRSGVASIRGVNSDNIILSLTQKGLVKEAGQSDEFGAMLYKVSKQFYDKFGLSGAADLPDLSEFVPDAETLDFIKARLNQSLGQSQEQTSEQFAEQSLEQSQ